MKERGIELWSGIPNKKYDSKEVYELIHIASCFYELREKDSKEVYELIHIANCFPELREKK